MATAALPRWQTDALAQRYWPVLAVAALALVCVAINPVGFVGGGGDDRHYLEAARCWVAKGAPCLPTNHWWTRWPVVAPMAAAVALFGESRASLGLGAFLYWAATIALTGWLGARWFGRTAGLLAVALLALTPVFTASALQPNADVAELAFQLAALAAATTAFDRQSRGWALGAGLLAGVAMQTRDTSAAFAAAAAVGWFFLPRDRRGVLLWAVPGMLAAMVGEALAYAIAAGDPLLRYKLALGHVAVPSDELAAGVDTRASPLFNPAYVAGWKREMGIRIAWPVDPWLNLLVSPKIMQTFVASALLGGLYWKLVSADAQRKLVSVGGIALLVAVLLVYGLAVDPKPRMFLALAAACALASGVFAAAALRNGQRLFPAFIVGSCALFGLHVLSIFPASYPAEARAREWIASYPAALEIDDRARRLLTLIPQARALPPIGSGRALLITTAVHQCAALRRPKSGRLAHVRLLDSYGGPNPDQPQLCLWAYPAAKS